MDYQQRFCHKYNDVSTSHHALLTVIINSKVLREAFHLIYFHVRVILLGFCPDSNSWRDMRCQNDFEDAICHSEEDRVIFLLLQEDKVILLYLVGKRFLLHLEEDKVILLHLGGRGFLLHLEGKVILLHLEG